MADKTEALVLQMSADIRRMEKALSQARGQTNRQLGEVEKRFDRMNAHVQRAGDTMARDLRASIASIGVGLALREVVDYGDAWTTARNKLAAAGVEQGALNGTMSDLVELAKDTRSELSGTVDLYAKLTRAGQQLGLSQVEVRKITETTLQAFVAGGAAASEQAAAITQLSQALGSGVLQGDELRSIRENAPLLAEAIAKEFDTTIAGLKDLGAEGVLTADRVAKAILNADGITESFGKTITTVAQALINLQTEFTRYIAESRVAQTVFQALGGFIQFVTDNIDLLADAAIIAAGVIGGTLAVQAIGRFVASLRTARLEAAAAGVQFGLLRVAMGFLSGPVGAIILGIGGALLSMATNTETAASAADRAADAFGRVSKIQDEMAANQKALVTAQEALTKAIQEGGVASQVAATFEVERLRKALAGNKALLDIEKTRAAIAVRDRGREFATKAAVLPGLSEEENRAALGVFAGQSLQTLYGRFALPELSKRGVTGAQFVEQMSTKARTQDLTAQEDLLFKLVAAANDYDAELAALKQKLVELDTISASLDPNDIVSMPTIGDDKGKGGGTGGAKGYRTELEKLKDTLNGLAEAAKKDADAFLQADVAISSYEDSSNDAGDAFSVELEKRKQQFSELRDALAENSVARSREAVQAVLDFAQSGEIAQAFGQIPSVREYLVGGDEALLTTELSKLAKDAADAVAVGVDLIAVEFEKGFTEIARAREAAIAAGEQDLSRFDRAAEELANTLDASLNERIDVPFPYDMEEISSQLTDGLKGVEWEIAGEELRQAMRESVKTALREGIRTGDWGDSFAMILADAVTTGLDDALNRVGDFLAELLFSDNGLITNIINGASAAIFGGPTGARAGGGSVQAGRGYRINDRGDKGEFLFMGSNPGQVLRQSDIAGMLGGSGGPQAIDASITFTGPIDATNMQQVQAMLEQQRRQIMAVMPAAVNGTLQYNRKQQRRI